MAFKFPSFDKGSGETLLQAQWAKLVKQFIEAWNNVTIRPSNKNRFHISKNNVVIEFDTRNETDTGAVAGGAAEGAAIDILGSDCKINKVPKHSTWTTPTTYPTLLKTSGGAADILIGPNDLIVAPPGGGSTYSQLTKNSIVLVNGGNNLEILASSLARPMSIRTIQVCDDGTLKNMDVIASAPY